jgi:hypothetical protein
MRKIFSILIVGIIFVVSIYLIAQIPRSRSSSDFDNVPSTGESTEEWLGIFLQGQRIGYSFTKTVDAGTGLTVENRTSMTLNMMGSMRTLNTHLFAKTDDQYTLEEFSVNIATPGHETRVEGKVQGNILQLTSHTQGIAQTETVTLDEKPYFPEAIEVLLKKRGLKPGDEISIPYFDPTTQSSTSARIKVVGKEAVRVFEKEITGTRVEITAMGMRSVMWLDDDYSLIKESTPAMGIDMIPISREEALAEVESGEAFDLLSFFSVKLDPPLPDPRTLSYVKLQLENIDYENLDLTDDYQSVINTAPLQIEFLLPDLNELPVCSLPIHEHTEYLKPTMYIQCDAQEIIDKAREIIGTEKDAHKAAHMLVQGVYRYVDKNPTASLPSAIDVLRTREGDCTEHSILFAALARAAGIPTKIYVGLVNLRGDEYFYHAWCAVWLDTWVPVDPTFNQFPADLGHMKLKEGGLAEWAKVMQVVGQLQIIAIEYKTHE